MHASHYIFLYVLYESYFHRNPAPRMSNDADLISFPHALSTGPRALAVKCPKTNLTNRIRTHVRSGVNRTCVFLHVGFSRGPLRRTRDIRRVFEKCIMSIRFKVVERALYSAPTDRPGVIKRPRIVIDTSENPHRQPCSVTRASESYYRTAEVFVHRPTYPHLTRLFAKAQMCSLCKRTWPKMGAFRARQ